MAKSKHYMKIFSTDQADSYVLNCDGNTTVVKSGAEQLAAGMGREIKEKMTNILKASNEAIYGFRIDYTLTPIRTDPFK